MATAYKAQAPNESLRANQDDILQSIGKANQVLVDARPAEMYGSPTKTGAARAEHIPGAVNPAALQETNRRRLSRNRDVGRENLCNLSIDPPPCFMLV